MNSNIKRCKRELNYESSAEYYHAANPLTAIDQWYQHAVVWISKVNSMMKPSF